VAGGQEPRHCAHRVHLAPTWHNPTLAHPCCPRVHWHPDGGCQWVKQNKTRRTMIAAWCSSSRVELKLKRTSSRTRAQAPTCASYEAGVHSDMPYNTGRGVRAGIAGLVLLASARRFYEPASRSAIPCVTETTARADTPEIVCFSNQTDFTAATRVPGGPEAGQALAFRRPSVTAS
jgi:hypothetical protein